MSALLRRFFCTIKLPIAIMKMILYSKSRLVSLLFVIYLVFPHLTPLIEVGDDQKLLN